MKEIKRVRKSKNKDVKKARNSLTRVMQHLQTFADNTEKDKDVPHHQTTSFFGPLTKAGKEDGSLGGDGAKEVFKMAKEIIAKQQAEEDADDDDSDVEMIIEGLTSMSDAGIMEYDTFESPGNFKGDSSVHKFAPFKGNFDDTDKPDDEEDDEELDDDDEEEDDEVDEEEEEEDDDDKSDWSRRTLIATAREISIMACSTRRRCCIETALADS